MGIDVGGTFPKAVLVDNASHEVVGRFSVLTTHAGPRGVAKGVVDVFRNVLEQSSVDPTEVVFLAHSTTQATNALLEGDVASVGVIGMSTRVESLLAKSQSAMKPIELAPGRHMKPANRFLMKEKLTAESIVHALEELKAEGAKVIVASSAFGVDDNEAEETVRRLAVEAGLAATCGNEITKLYGLTTRTRPAVINASILPKMIDTATMTAASAREAGIKAPLMIMRGDGGVMDIREMRRRPVMTMLSGPAASVAGALMYLRISDGIYFEVGGTSTNIGVIRNGRPTVKYARVGGHETLVKSLDVRLIRIAGGSLVRSLTGNLLDIATDKVIPVVDDLIAEYKLDRDQAVLVGEGGGAAALIPHASSRTGLRHEISRDAEVISSIGVALALVRDVVERVIPNPQPEDLNRIRREAFETAVTLVATPENVEVTIVVDHQTHRGHA